MTDSRIAAAADAVAEQGFAIVPDAVPPALRRDLIAGLERIERAHGHGFGETAFEGRRTVRIYNLLRYGAPFTAVPVAEPARSIAEAVLGEDLLLSSLSAITLAPGEAAQALHSDSQLISLRRPHPCLMLNAFWVLTDFTEANGATRIVPGSHKNPKPPKYGETYDTIPAEAPAGSLILFDSQLWHGGGANRTSERRWAISNYYCAGWVRQQENPFLSLPAETVRGFSEPLQRLCGYGLYRGLYGHVEGRDPRALLTGEPGRPNVWQETDALSAP
ncbi:MAG: phytanoyl-CoA dioxygenase family protein [Alphaproteobacteria bacterium]|nr:phytanoyl-CoA dioxygenase family protein [Alphaproteobacteria bacterium]MCB9927824.1 phytanoyl-CoA dioxygenase family protein [Alphaproteobacteria bacterium]